MRAAVLALLLAVQAPAQLFTPYNVEGMQGAALHPFVSAYRPHLLVQWDPSVAPFPLTLHLHGVQAKLTVRELAIIHPPGWSGAWSGFQVGTRLVSLDTNWPAIYGVWPWGGGGFEHIRGLNVRLNAPGEIGVDYGTWLGACCYGYHPKPTLCAMIVEVTL